MRPVGIRHLSFAVGDQAVWYRDLPRFEERLRRFDIPDDEDLWKWGYCRRSALSYEEYVTAGFAEATAHLTGTRPGVEAVAVCGPVQTGIDRFIGALSSRVLPAIGIAPGAVHRVEDRDCANLLQAVADAATLIASGCRDVLVVAAEKVEREHCRFRKYSLFSDFCLALVVSGDLSQCDYEVLGLEVRAEARPGHDTSAILLRGLEKDCISSLLAAAGVSRRQIDKMFYLNLFEPIAEMKAKQAGFTSSQLYLRNTRRWAHCYGADPFINLHTFVSECGVSEGGADGPYLLCASGRAHAGVALVRRLR